MFSFHSIFGMFVEKELASLAVECNRRLAMLRWNQFGMSEAVGFNMSEAVHQLVRIRYLCAAQGNLCSFLVVRRLREKLEQVWSGLEKQASVPYAAFWLKKQASSDGSCDLKVIKHASSDYGSCLKFSVSSALEGGIYINIGSLSIYAPDSLRVNHPLHQMVLFADQTFPDGSFSCFKFMARKSIKYINRWISRKWKSESANEVRNPPCKSKKPLLPADINISVSKKTSSNVPVVSQSGNNGNSGPYDSSMAADKANCGVSNRSILELGEAGNRLSGLEDANNCQQHSTLTGGSHVARQQVPTAQEVACISAISVEKMPTAASFVKCGDADESIMLAKRTSLQEQFILNHSGGDGGGDSPHSNSALKITPFAESTFTPRVPDLIETHPQHLRGLSVSPQNNNQQGASILMMNGGGGTNGVSIIDSGGAVHATGNISLFTQLGPEPQGTKIFAANGEQMPSFGYGSISNPSLGLKLDRCYYVPCMENKTIVSVAELNKLGYSVNFSQAGCSIRDERTWTRKLVGEARHINGQFVLEYLNIHTASDGTLTSLWRVVCSKWSTFTKSLFQSSNTLPQ